GPAVVRSLVTKASTSDSVRCPFVSMSAQRLYVPRYAPTKGAISEPSTTPSPLMSPAHVGHSHSSGPPLVLTSALFGGTLAVVTVRVQFRIVPLSAAALSEAASVQAPNASTLFRPESAVPASVVAVGRKPGKAWTASRLVVQLKVVVP